MARKRILVCGAGGFIGGHLVKDLLAQGHDVYGADIKGAWQWWQRDPRCVVNYASTDLRDPVACAHVCKGKDEIYMLAADMGGMGFIETHKLDCSLSVLISTNMLREAARAGVERYFYSSSACVYPDYLQGDAAVTALHELDAYPAMPEDGYGWEKLFSERMARHFREETDMDTRVARYHNVYGTHTAWQGGREKAPAAICRKVAEAVVTGQHEIEIWGDGEQTRSFMEVADCVYGTQLIMNSDYVDPLNLGSSELVSINGLVSIVEGIAGVELERHYKLDAPLGVRGRNSDNTLIQEVLGWEPSTTLLDGLTNLYTWVYDEVASIHG